MNEIEANDDLAQAQAQAQALAAAHRVRCSPETDLDASLIGPDPATN